MTFSIVIKRRLVYKVKCCSLFATSCKHGCSGSKLGSYSSLLYKDFNEKEHGTWKTAQKLPNNWNPKHKSTVKFEPMSRQIKKISKYIIQAVFCFGWIVHWEHFFGNGDASRAAHLFSGLSDPVRC